MTKAYATVADMLQSIVADRQFVDDYRQQLVRRQFSKALQIFRSLRGITQEELGLQLGGRSPGYINQLGGGNDSDLKLGDLCEYLRGLGLGLEITVTATPQLKLDFGPAMDHLKHLAEVIQGYENEAAESGLGEF